MNQLLTELRRSTGTFLVEEFKKMESHHQTALQALFFLQSKTEATNVLSSHFQFLTSYVNAMQLFHKDATTRMDFHTMEIGNLQQQLEKLPGASDDNKETEIDLSQDIYGCYNIS